MGQDEQTQTLAMSAMRLEKHRSAAGRGNPAPTDENGGADIGTNAGDFAEGRMGRRNVSRRPETED
jgi:hypothetical protein